MTPAIILLAMQAAPQPGVAALDVSLFQDVCTQGGQRFKQGEVKPTTFKSLPLSARSSLTGLWQPDGPHVATVPPTTVRSGVYHVLRGDGRKRFLAVEERITDRLQRLRVCTVFTKDITFEGAVSGLDRNAKTETMKSYAYSPHPGGWLTGQTNRWFQKSNLGYTIVVQRLSGGLISLQSQLPL